MNHLDSALSADADDGSDDGEPPRRKEESG